MQESRPGSSRREESSPLMLTKLISPMSHSLSTGPISEMKKLRLRMAVAPVKATGMDYSISDWKLANCISIARTLQRREVSPRGRKRPTATCTPSCSAAAGEAGGGASMEPGNLHSLPTVSPSGWRIAVLGEGSAGPSFASRCGENNPASLGTQCHVTEVAASVSRELESSLPGPSLCCIPQCQVASVTCTSRTWGEERLRRAPDTEQGLPRATDLKARHRVGSSRCCKE